MKGAFDRDNSTACLDAETLAAWADDGLSAERVREVEVHVASCARCRALSATFFSTADSAAAPGGAATNVVPFKRNRLMYWMPIAAGIAATLVVWLGWPTREAPSPELTMSKTVPEAAPAQPSAGFGNQQEQEAQRNALQRLDQLKSTESRSERAAKPAEPSAIKQDAAAKRAPAGTVGGVVSGNAAAAPPPPPAYAAPPAAAGAAPPPKLTPTPTPATPVVTAAPPVIVPPPNAAASTARELAFRSSEEIIRVIAEFSTDDPKLSTISSTVGVSGIAAGGGAGRGIGAAGRAGAAGGRGGGGGGGGAAIVADSARLATTYWRILATGAVERSTDRVAWTAIAIDPAPQGLAAGSAPLPNVCWLAGKAGLVLVSIDGRNFARVAAPTDADLSAITAANAFQASVRTADGRTFTTSDGGKTWK